VSHEPSRKHFFAKLAGLFAVVGLAPKLLAKQQPGRMTSVKPVAPIALRPEVRAVSRRESTI